VVEKFGYGNYKRNTISEQVSTEDFKLPMKNIEIKTDYKGKFLPLHKLEEFLCPCGA